MYRLHIICPKEFVKLARVASYTLGYSKTPESDYTFAIGKDSITHYGLSTLASHEFCATIKQSIENGNEFDFGDPIQVPGDFLQLLEVLEARITSGEDPRKEFEDFLNSKGLCAYDFEKYD